MGEIIIIMETVVLKKGEIVVVWVFMYLQHRSKLKFSGGVGSFFLFFLRWGMNEEQINLPGLFC